MDSNARVSALEKKLADLSKMVTFRLLGNNPALVYGPPESSTSSATVLTATDISAPVFAQDAGASDTYTGSLSPTISSYVTGTHYRFMANTANTGPATINLNSIGAKTIVKVAGGITTALADNDIRAGQWVDLVYDGTNMQMQSTLGNAPAASGPTARVKTVAAFDAMVPADYQVGDSFSLSDGIYEVVRDTSSWYYKHAGTKCVRPDDSQFSWVNQGTAAVSTASGGILLGDTQNSGRNHRSRVKTIPTAPYTVTMRCSVTLQPNPIGSDYYGGMILRESGSGKTVTLLLGQPASGNGYVGLYKWNSATSFNAAYVEGTASGVVNRFDAYLRVVDDNTNRKIYLSNDGVDYELIYSVGRTDFITPDQIGFLVDSNGTNKRVALLVKSWEEI